LAGGSVRLQHPDLRGHPPDRVRRGRRHRHRLRIRSGHPLGARVDRRRSQAGGVMWIPIKYNLRNLVVRKVSTAMTVLGIALVVGRASCRERVWSSEGVADAAEV